jgi:cation:H+ antiporter
MVFIVRQSRAVTGASRAVTRQRRTLNRQKASEASTGTEALNPEAVIPSAGLPLYLCLLFVVLGGGMLVFGSRFLVRGAITVAELAGMSEAVIGLTIIAIGTSLPELVTSVVAALKKEVDIAVGNVVGSNLFNLLAIGGTASLINPMGSGEMSYLDFGVMLGFTILLLPFLRTKFTLSRVEGFIFVAVYGFYTTYLVTTAIS